MIGNFFIILMKMARKLREFQLRVGLQILKSRNTNKRLHFTKNIYLKSIRNMKIMTLLMLIKSEIPMNYSGAIGVLITFLDKYNPEQFEIIGLGISNSGIEIELNHIKKNIKI